MKRNQPHGLAMGLFLALLTAWMATGSAQSTARLTSPATALPVEPPAPSPTTASYGTTAMADPTSTRAPALLAPSPTTRPPATERPIVTPSPAESPTPVAPVTPPASVPAGVVEEIIGSSVEGRPLTAFGLGQGEIKVVLVGDIHGGYEANTYELTRQLLAHFKAHPEEVPDDVSLWFLPTINPDGLENNGRWNANDVDLNRNADTDMDGCAGNDWSPDTVSSEGSHPGAGGAYPFSEPETLALRNFVVDARIVILYHSAFGGIFRDACQRHLPTARLAEVLSAGTGYPIPAEGWTGYPVTGDFGDYLAGEGVAAVTVELTNHDDPEFERNISGVRAVLGAAQEIVTAEAAAAGGQHTWLVPGREGNLGTWQYPEGSFVHPLALEVIGGTGYLLDSGRVLALDLGQADLPQPILVPGDYVESVRVLEPLDLATDDHSLLVLDRAGDVYRYSPGSGTWSIARYDRPAGESYDHYFVALAGSDEGVTYLLETTREQVWRFAPGEMGAAWAGLPKGRDVDLWAGSEGLYVLTRALNGPSASLLRYTDGQGLAAFQPAVVLMHPRQVTSDGSELYVLDRAGRRLLALEPQNGALEDAYEFADRRSVTTVWAAPGGSEEPASAALILAGRDTLYFYREPERQAIIEGVISSTAQPHDPTRLEGIRGLKVPIEGASLTNRDFQMPGAPRHYRLGVHEGMDFYGHTVGVTVNRDTAVRAVADGIVIRALVDYQPLTVDQSATWQELCLSLGYTPEEVLDGYRGRQIWIDHGEGLVSRYAHLGSIAAGIVEGAPVSQGQVIATVGNSGTPGSISSSTYDVHLHLELWIGDHYVGQFLRPIEAREWLEGVLR